LKNPNCRKHKIQDFYYETKITIYLLIFFHDSPLLLTDQTIKTKIPKAEGLSLEFFVGFPSYILGENLNE